MFLQARLRPGRGPYLLHHHHWMVLLCWELAAAHLTKVRVVVGVVVAVSVLRGRRLCPSQQHTSPRHWLPWCCHTRRQLIMLKACGVIKHRVRCNQHCSDPALLDKPRLGLHLSQNTPCAGCADWSWCDVISQ